MTNSVSDLLHAGSDPLRPTVAPAQAVRRRAEQRRRHRRIVAVMTPALLVALILGLSATGELRNSSAPPPPATHGPHPAPALLTLTAHPFRTDIEGARIRAGAPPVALSSCGSSPLTWGAAESSAATYRGAGQPRFANEFVLRYDSVAAAHRAVTDAWREFVDCPTPQHVDTDAGAPPVQSAKWRLSEFFGSERLRRATPRLPGDRAQVATVYSLRVARVRTSSWSWRPQVWTTGPTSSWGWRWARPQEGFHPSLTTRSSNEWTDVVLGLAMVVRSLASHLTDPQ